VSRRIEPQAVFERLAQGYAPQMMLRKRRDLIWLLVLVPASFIAKVVAQDVSLSRDFRGRQVIVLDPGHGGHDLGAIGPSGLAEKDVTLSLAKRIKEILSGTYAVHLTRDADYWVSIESRTAFANQRLAAVFISLHAGGSFEHKARGMAIFLHGPGSAQGLSPEPAEHVGDGGETIGLWNQIQLRHTAKSKCLADLVHNELVERVNPMDRGIREAPCLVLRGADMPAILVEVGYVSHPAEETELRDPEVISTAAEAVCQGIRRFFTQTSGCMKAKGMIEEKV
jgi:N-acetylmuramoyl-L-alanine amidase